MRLCPASFSLLLAITGCSSPKTEDPVRNLSPDDAAAFVIFLDQLNQFAETQRSSEQEWPFCLGLSIPWQSDRLLEPEFIERLQANAPRNPRIVVVSKVDCIKDPLWGYRLPTGEQAFLLTASFNPDVTVQQGQWVASYACGPLCGAGNLYRIDMTNGRPFASRIGQILY